MTVDLSGPALRVAVVGVGGAGMGAIAEVLVRMGHSVAGTDQQESAMTRRLAVVRIDVENEGRLVAAAQGTCTIVAPRPNT